MTRPDVTRVRTAGDDNRSPGHSLTPLAVPLLLKPLVAAADADTGVQALRTAAVVRAMELGTAR